MFQHSKSTSPSRSSPSSFDRAMYGNDACGVSMLPEDPSVVPNEQEPHVFPTYPKEYHKTILAILLMCFSTCMNGIVAALITDLVPRTPIPDIMFRIFPEQPWAWKVSDTITLTLSMSNLGFAMLHKHRWILTRRFCFISSQLYLLRALCMAVTWVAVPGKYHATRCVPIADEDKYWETIFVRISRFMLSFGLSAEPGGNHHLCGDLIFSGHTLILLLSWYSLDIHLPLRRCRFVRLMAGFMAVFGMVMIILCRMHYTVDVVLAFALTTLYFILYHMIVDGEIDKRWKSYVLMVLWLLPILKYFERNVPRGKVPRVLEWPFNRPIFVRQMVKKMND